MGGLGPLRGLVAPLALALTLGETGGGGKLSRFRFAVLPLGRLAAWRELNCMVRAEIAEGRRRAGNCELRTD